MKKRKLMSMFLLCFALTGIQAQQTTTAAGGEATGSGGTQSYSVGQVVYAATSNSSGSINEGVQQPFDIATLIPDNKTINLTYSVYPNPILSVLNLNVGNTATDNLFFELYDVSGKLLLKDKIVNSNTTITMENYAAANYLLTVTDNNKAVQTFKIIKN